MRILILLLILVMLATTTSLAANPPAPVAATGQTATYGSGDDGARTPGVAWPSPRFVDHGNGTVTDQVTGLIWLKDTNCIASRVWSDAVAAARVLAGGSCGLVDGSVAGDWHLPTVRELESLVDISRSGPALPAGHPFTGDQSKNSFGQLISYWSSSTGGAGTNSAWLVNMGTGIVTYSYMTDRNYGWPVRGGQ